MRIQICEKLLTSSGALCGYNLFPWLKRLSSHNLPSDNDVTDAISNIFKAQDTTFNKEGINILLHLWPQTKHLVTRMYTQTYAGMMHVQIHPSTHLWIKHSMIPCNVLTEMSNAF